MDVNLSLTGVEQIDRLLKGFPDQFNHRVLQAAHADAAKPLVNKIHRLAPVGRTGRLADSIGIVKPPFGRSVTIGEIQVGPRRGLYGGHAAHLIEFGTKDRKTIKSHPIFGRNRGKMTAEPFVEPAYLATKDEVLSRIAVSLAQKTYSFMKRTIKNG